MKSQKPGENITRSSKSALQVEAPRPVEDWKTSGQDRDSNRAMKAPGEVVSGEPAPDANQDGSTQNRGSGTSRDVATDTGKGHPYTGARSLAGKGGLAVILGQLVAYFSGRADADDLDVLSFCLHHLFCRVDFLFHHVLPDFGESTAPTTAGETFVDGMMRRQHTWMQLQLIQRTLDRMESLCHLLSDATECILDSFDATSERTRSIEDAQGTIATHSDETGYGPEEQMLFIDEAHWEQGLLALCESLVSWQEHQSKLTPFALQFAHLPSTVPSIGKFDMALAMLLESAGAIFGDILPGFHGVSAHDDTAIAALLLDLVQQSDQLLLHFETILEPLDTLSNQFAVGATIF